MYNVRTHQLIGVLQAELPYAPIAAQMNAGLHQLYLALGSGLLILYLVLATLVWWFTRELARTAARFEHQPCTTRSPTCPTRPSSRTGSRRPRRWSNGAAASI